MEYVYNILKGHQLSNYAEKVKIGVRLLESEEKIPFTEDDSSDITFYDKFVLLPIHQS